MLDIVADDAFGGRKIADAHPDDPAFHVGSGLRVAPLLDILAHRDVLRLPMVRLHRPVQVVRPLVLQGQQIEGHRQPAIDDPLGRKRGLRLRLVKVEGFGADGEAFLHGG